MGVHAALPNADGTFEEPFLRFCFTPEDLYEMHDLAPDSQLLNFSAAPGFEFLKSHMTVVATAAAVVTAALLFLSLSHPEFEIS